ncbi:LysR family transcriptional regulator, hydrogen peroxide-inducible genes activator [Catalinimonas alkaloidigena]|uniref:LysR family transcriptional regulator, hydrogen peroxide-inducible genes activator n=1 Tax=Catalinimonas alkaloidigena TaxID=1075417 RepID=A0A1G8YCC4_9BACT|nr:LysR substrate-binding domain-containing protein [Catalinimonas alkaloidigena]SDK00356.1 LysR family transcriptional regulator, hydrogen peroxide-inducible genes activator [Catalinimonas alkaloidigena]
MTLQQLQYVVALDTHRHFVTAAESCFVAQPTLTLQVKKLEEEIGLSLFDRSSQPLVPTPMGEKFIAKARQVLREAEGLKAMVNQEKNLMEGTFRLGVIPTLAPYLLPRFLHEFSENYPAIRLEIKEMQSEDLLRAIEEDVIDVGLLVTPTFQKHIREIPLFYEPFLIYAHKDSPILTREELQSEGFNEKGLWLLEKGHCFRNQVLNICSQADLLYASEQITFQTGSIETLKNIIQSHSGYTLIPELAVNKQTDAKFVRRFAEPQPAREVSLAVHHSFTKETFLSELRSAILTTIPNHFRKNGRFITVKWR